MSNESMHLPGNGTISAAAATTTLFEAERDN